MRVLLRQFHIFSVARINLNWSSLSQTFLKFIIIITAFLLFSESIGIFYLLHIENTESIVMTEDSESEEEKSSEKEMKKFDKNYLLLLAIMLSNNSSSNKFYIKHTSLYYSGFCSRLIQPPEMSWIQLLINYSSFSRQIPQICEHIIGKRVSPWRPKKHCNF